MRKTGNTEAAKRILENFAEDDTGPDSNNAGASDYSDAIASAQEYCLARNKNLRPVRPIDPNNEAAVEGQRSALSWLERRRLSVIRK
jgi:hypothetical protein